MPEYLAPGVYVEETSFRAKSIEGVSTTTTGFVGPTRFGPIDIEPDIVTSLVEFERTYGGRDRLKFTDAEVDNYMWHAVRAFFEEGGKRLYVSRIYAAGADPGFAKSGVASLKLRARFPGESGDGRVTFTFTAGQNILVLDKSNPGTPVNRVPSLANRDVVVITKNKLAGTPPGPVFESLELYLATWNPQTLAWNFVRKGQNGADVTVKLSDLNPEEKRDRIRIVTVSVAYASQVPGTVPFTTSELPIDPAHQRAGVPDSVFAILGEKPANLGLARTTPIVIGKPDPVGTTPVPASGLDFLGTLAGLPAGAGLIVAIKNPASSPEARSVTEFISGGSDGKLPAPDGYKGKEDAATGAKSGLVQFEDIEDISIVAAPGSTQGYAGDQSRAQSIVSLLLSHAERMRYRIAVIDCGDSQTVAGVREMRARFDSKYGAFYYPWVRTVDPLSQREIHLPPSGFVSGIYARNDINRAVYKAPANEVVNLAIGFEQMLNKAQQEVLNPEGINCFRFFEGRGMRLWGARTMSSDPEWKYVNIRRYFGYLERSIDKGTQWAVFEPNGEQLWANVRRTIEDFLLNEWQGGALLGEKPEKAFFVKCDRSTMSQNDLDNGRLICLIGIAPVKPAEFVIFRIGQWTADRRI